MDLAHLPPCLNIVRRQRQRTPEQGAYARRFVRERFVAMLEAEAAKNYLRRAYQVAGLASPCIRWFDSSVAFNRAREQVREREAKEQWDEIQACLSNLQAGIGFLPHRVSQRRLRSIGGIFLITGWLPQDWNLLWRYGPAWYSFSRWYFCGPGYRPG